MESTKGVTSVIETTWFRALVLVFAASILAVGAVVIFRSGRNG